MPRAGVAQEVRLTQLNCTAMHRMPAVVAPDDGLDIGRQYLHIVFVLQRWICYVEARCHSPEDDDDLVQSDSACCERQRNFTLHPATPTSKPCTNGFMPLLILYSLSGVSKTALAITCNLTFGYTTIGYTTKTVFELKACPLR